MATVLAAISVEQYLAASYEPDCEYVDGAIVERNSGERDHSWLQGILTSYLMTHRKQWGIRIFPAQRVQINPRRFRVPDITVVTGPMPKGQIFQEPPFLCIEILSPEDRMSRIIEKVKEYLTFGVQYVWVIDPANRSAWAYDHRGGHEVTDQLSTNQPDIMVSLADLFQELDEAKEA